MDDRILSALSTPTNANQTYRNQSTVSSLKAGKYSEADKDGARLRSACMEMESLFLTYMLKEMRATVEKSGFIGGGRAEEIFTSLLDVEISRKMSAAGGIGLAAILLNQLGGQAAGKDSQKL